MNRTKIIKTKLKFKHEPDMAILENLHGIDISDFIEDTNIDLASSKMTTTLNISVDSNTIYILGTAILTTIIIYKVNEKQDSVMSNKEYVNDIKNVNIILLKRYIDVLSEHAEISGTVERFIKLVELCHTAIDRAADFTIDKHSRWLGYIQRSLVSTGWISINEEREYSRSLYQEVYKKYNIEQETI